MTSIKFQVNAGTLLDFFNQLSKTPGPGGFSEPIDKVSVFKVMIFYWLKRDVTLQKRQVILTK